jgi:hypothetical protein
MRPGAGLCNVLEFCMLKKWLNFTFNGNGASSTGSLGPGPENHGLQLAEMDEEDERPSARPLSSDGAAPPKTAGFDQIYQNAAVKPPQIPYGILKLMSMAESPHLAGMTPEAKRCALLMALEAAGAEIEDLLQDAVVRQRALNDYEEKQQGRLRDFEAAKTEDNQAIQAELDRITDQHMVRIQANADEVVRQQDSVRGWQKRKQEECRRMTEAAAFLVSEGGTNHHRTLTAVLERASGTRR